MSADASSGASRPRRHAALVARSGGFDACFVLTGDTHLNDSGLQA